MRKKDLFPAMNSILPMYVLTTSTPDYTNVEILKFGTTKEEAIKKYEAELETCDTDEGGVGLFKVNGAGSFELGIECSSNGQIKTLKDSTYDC